MHLGSSLPTPTLNCAINSQHASTLSCQPKQSQALGPIVNPTTYKRFIFNVNIHIMLDIQMWRL